MSEREENVTPVPGAATGSDATPAAGAGRGRRDLAVLERSDGGDSQGDLFFSS